MEGYCEESEGDDRSGNKEGVKISCAEVSKVCYGVGSKETGLENARSFEFSQSRVPCDWSLEESSINFRLGRGASADEGKGEGKLGVDEAITEELVGSLVRVSSGDLGTNDLAVSSALVSGRSSAAVKASKKEDVSLVGNAGFLPVAQRRFGSGCSYAQILLAGAGASDPLKGCYADGSGDVGISSKLVHIKENPDHLQAILCNDDRGVVLYSRSDFLECVNDCMVSDLSGCAFEGQSAGSPLRSDIPSEVNGEVLAGEKNMQDSSCTYMDGVEVMEVSDHKAEVPKDVMGSMEEKAGSTEDARVSDRVSNEVDGTQSGFSSVSAAEEVNGQEVEHVEDSPMSAEEKAEIKDQVRVIIHDALRIGKAMSINVTPRDARMIKRFAVLRHFDKEKWSMSFDKVEDQLL